MVLLELQALIHPSRIARSIERGCRWLLAITLLAVIYRFCWIDASDPFKCGALLHKGKWLDHGTDPISSFQKWQPPGCLIHEYNERDIHDCLGGRRLVFAGDSITRQVFWAVAKKLDQDRARNRTSELLELDHKHEDLRFVSNGVTLEFLWDPYLNTSALEYELRLFRVNSSGDSASESAALLLLGAPGLWYARSGQDNYMRQFRNGIDRIIPYMDHIPWNNTTPDTYVKPLSSPNILLLAPIQVPRYEFLSPTREETITPEKVDQMNDYLQQTSAYSNADVLWSFSRMTSSGKYEYMKDGLHVIENVANGKADILLNLRCNNDAAGSGSPFDRTCCSDYGQTSKTQLVLLFCGMIVVPVLFLLRQKNLHRSASLLPPLEVVRASKVLCLVICFCFFTDRTQLFEKAPRLVPDSSVIVPFLGVVLISLAYVQRSKTSSTVRRPSQDLAESQFLSREQTDEWKGWMQAIILIYHYIRGSQTLWLYQLVQLFVASYLFMTGFGHTLYFLQTQDYSMKRMLHILIRVNILSCILPYMMRTEYMFYYFTPLVSFWFLVIYITLRIRHERNDDLGFVFGKLLLSCTLTTACTIVPGVWAAVSTLLRYTCNMEWDSQEWRSLIQLDRYIVYVGMTVAILARRCTASRSRATGARTRFDNALAFILAQPSLLKLMTITISPLLLWSFFASQKYFSTKKDYDLWQPYLSILPILGFVGLRNCLQMFRDYNSATFSWLGRCSLETYVLQSHLWLAADMTAVLRIGVGDDWLQVAILTIIFLWTSHLTRHATQILTEWVVGTSSSTSRGRASSFPDNHGKDSPRQLPSSGSRKHGIQDLGDRWATSRGGLNLKWRLVLIVFGLWFCNILS